MRSPARAAATLIACVCVCACGQSGPKREAAVDAHPEGAVVIAKRVDAGPTGPEVVVIDRVTAEESFWPTEAGPAPDNSKILERIEGELSLSNLFVLAVDVPSGARVRRARLRGAYGVEMVPASSTTPPTVRGAFSIALEWPGDPEAATLQESALCDRVLEKKGDPAADAQAMLECAVSSGLKGIVEKEKVRRGDELSVLAALDSEDPSLRQVAFAAVGEHKLKSATTRLLALLKSDDVYARDGAIGALVALREPRAVKALTEMVQFRDLDMMRRVIDAVGAIGGEDARSYLEFVASGHDVPEVRELAQQALKRLERREGAGGAGGATPPR